MSLLQKNDPVREVLQLRRKQAAYRRMLLGLVKEVIITAAAAAFIFTHVFGIMTQKGNDMYPAIRDGDVVLYYRNADLMITDAVVYEIDSQTGNSDTAGQDTVLRTGRIAGRSGTVISETGDHQLTFDGIYQVESYERGIWGKTYSAKGEHLPLTVSGGAYYILNDRRERDSDSRKYGEIAGKNIKGRIIAVIRRRSI